MAVYINTVAGEPDYGSLPAAKIIDYPLEKRDYRPFAQVQLALGAHALFARLISFETRPDPASRLTLLFAFPAGRAGLSVTAGGELQTLPPTLDIQKRETAGEDLQGIFWGAECVLPRAELERLAGRALAPGDTLYGNVFKTSEGGAMPPHFGCLYPSRPVYTLQELSALEAEDLGPFQVTGY